VVPKEDLVPEVNHFLSADGFAEDELSQLRSMGADVRISREGPTVQQGTEWVRYTLELRWAPSGALSVNRNSTERRRLVMVGEEASSLLAEAARIVMASRQTD
jgi:hypothetical protein